MASKEQSVIFVSPFKFGFFAGLGFFVASALMTVLSFVLVIAMGLGTLGALLTGAHVTHDNPVHDAKPVATISENQ